MYNVLTGAQMYSVRGLTQTAEGLDGALKAISEMGYTSVQLSGHSPEIDIYLIKDMLDKYGLRCYATHTSFKDIEENTDEVIKRHKLWNCEYPGVGSMPFDMAGTEEGIRAFAKRAEAMAEKLADAGLKFIYHNHAFEFQRFGGITGMDILFDEFRKTQFELDVFWVQTGGGDPVEWIKKVAGRMDVVHFKEMVGCLPDKTTRSMSRMAPIGEGNLDWRRIQQACDDTGVKYAFIEQDNANDEPDHGLGCMKTSITNLKKLGGRF